MSILGNLYSRLEGHFGEIVMVSMLGSAIMGVRGCIKSLGEEVYRGNIDGKNVVYEENRFLFFAPDESGKGKNIMTVTNGDQKYILEDIVEMVGVRSPDFENQELERILIESKEGTKVYFSKEEYSQSLEDQHRKSIFERGNELYNHLRTKIRAEIESNYRATEQQIPE